MIGELGPIRLYEKRFETFLMFNQFTENDLFMLQEREQFFEMASHIDSLDGKIDMAIATSFF